MGRRSRPSLTGMDDRDAVVAEFDHSRQEFEEAVRRAPDAALRFKPPGEDYALGGLVVHVAQVLRHYAEVVDAIRVAEWQALHAPDNGPTAEETTLIHTGFGGDARASVLEDMRSAHAALVDAIRVSAPDAFRRQAAVIYSGASDAYPTSAADVVGWVQDHYKEHTQQIADLVSAWAQATR
jgi:hypothetical protein